MTRGVLIFAFNNEKIDYIKLSHFSAKRVREYLNVPVTLVTDKKIDSNDLFDQVIIVDSPNSQNRLFYDGCENSFVGGWHNLTRFNSFELSPYDETLVIDSDYIINSSFLNCCWNKTSDFLIFKESFDLASWRKIKEFDKISEYSIDFVWATVFYFKKTQKNKLFFNLVEHIKNNWHFYMMMYQCLSPHYRNDIAFSIAIHMFNGFTSEKFLEYFPGNMNYVLDIDHLLDYKNNKMQFLLEHPTNPSQYILSKTEGIDVHVMNKSSLLRLIDKKEIHE